MFLKDIRGITYGKVSEILHKKWNEPLEAWLCFTIYAKDRELDILAEEDNINPWIIGLSSIIKSYNSNAFTLRAGRYFWRKLRFLVSVFCETELQKSNLSLVKMIIIAHHKRVI